MYNGLFTRIRPSGLSSLLFTIKCTLYSGPPSCNMNSKVSYIPSLGFSAYFQCSGGTRLLEYFIWFMGLKGYVVYELIPFDEILISMTIFSSMRTWLA